MALVLPGRLIRPQLRAIWVELSGRGVNLPSRERVDGRNRQACNVQMLM